MKNTNEKEYVILSLGLFSMDCGSYCSEDCYNSSCDYESSFYAGTLTGCNETQRSQVREDNWDVSFRVVNGSVVRETDGALTVTINESCSYSENALSSECSEESYACTMSGHHPYSPLHSGTYTEHSERDVTYSASGGRTFSENITADWTNYADENGTLIYNISADSQITSSSCADYEGYYHALHFEQFDGCYHQSNSSSDGNSSSYSCTDSTLSTYSDGEVTYRNSEHFESAFNESRHSDGGAFTRVSFSGCANGNGTSIYDSHSCGNYEWDCCRDSGYFFSESCQCHDSSRETVTECSSSENESCASYEYAASWDGSGGTPSYSFDNSVTGYRDRGYRYDCTYTYCCSGGGWSDHTGCGDDYPGDDVDYDESVLYSGWGEPDTHTSLPFSVKWQGGSGSITDGSACGGCFCYNYSGFAFTSPNASVSMMTDTSSGEAVNSTWHCSVPSGVAPFSFIPAGSVPSTPSGSGSTDALELKIVTVGNPNFVNYASIDVDAYLPKPPEPAVETSNPSSAIYSFAQFTWGFAVTGPYNLAAGLYQVARHPIQTVKGLANAVMHPVQTAKAIYQDVKEKAGTSQGRGELTFDVAISAVAYLKITRVTEAAKALETIDDVSDGAKAAASAGKNAAKAGKKFSKDLGKNLEDAGIPRPKDMNNPQAHHDLPQNEKFRHHFDDAGLDINDPQYGRWVEGARKRSELPPGEKNVGTHQNWSKAYDKKWKEFFKKKPKATREEILDFMYRLREEFPPPKTQ